MCVRKRAPSFPFWLYSLLWHAFSCFTFSPVECYLLDCETNIKILNYLYNLPFLSFFLSFPLPLSFLLSLAQKEESSFITHKNIMQSRHYKKRKKCNSIFLNLLNFFLSLSFTPFFFAFEMEKKLFAHLRERNSGPGKGTYGQGPSM